MPFTINYPLSTINYTLLTIHYQLYTTAYNYILSEEDTATAVLF
ncbi:hypothetical protein CLV50_0230 [Flavobacterium lindanitolerans]|uniref:Uncharacterized protein n=1 Tax=Flavobacterium lindanitolerans TaxID=428988 RepID=A0A497V2D8_9FLAO|nr:hypothetical protein B0G92_1274 [Flavobacterium lindanitolerans]RLJ34868.1 hypothetical protein CLV50_0230 [Flavobacterium lindanitolerans]